MNIRKHLLKGHVIPALPLALDCRRRLSEKHEGALVRYYVESGAGGLAVGVHSTQFEIREPKHALLEPVLALASQTIDASLKHTKRDFIKIAGICGNTKQACSEAALAASLGYHAGLLSMTAVQHRPLPAVLDHCRAVSRVIPIIGFYMQNAVGGRTFPRSFWHKLADIPNLVAVKIAPFNRYQTIDVVQAVADAGRDDVALYTGNDDNIIVDLLTPFHVSCGKRKTVRWISGGLLGQWGVWTRKAVLLLEEIKKTRKTTGNINVSWLTSAAKLTDINGAIFDAANSFAGCIPGILEVLRRQGMVPTALCLNSRVSLSLGQSQEITRVTNAYPEFSDDDFVREHKARWLI